MTTLQFDRRTTPARGDRAAAYLDGQIEASSYVQGETRTAMAALAPLRREPRADCPLDTEILRGEVAVVYEDAEGWAWVQLARDRYVGYVESAALGPPETSTHKVTVTRALVFPGPNLKLPIVSALPLGSLVAVQDRSGRYAKIAEGWVWADHLGPTDACEADFVAVAERFIGVPYLWGGKSSMGIDCSGLVQVSLQAVGIEAPRDSDMQGHDLGAPVEVGVPFRRGDLVFWRGHVGIMRDANTLIHANAHAMMVSSEPLQEVQRRTESQPGEHYSVKRLMLQQG